jgi:hypothetical protein
MAIVANRYSAGWPLQRAEVELRKNTMRRLQELICRTQSCFVISPTIRKSLLGSILRSSG